MSKRVDRVLLVPESEFVQTLGSLAVATSLTATPAEVRAVDMDGVVLMMSEGQEVYDKTPVPGRLIRKRDGAVFVALDVANYQSGWVGQ